MGSTASGVRCRAFGRRGVLCKAPLLPRNNRGEVETEKEEMVLHDVV